MSWTDERIDLLKRLWGEGLSASQIAGQLGGVSRNAVIGKVHRLKLDSRIKPAGPAEPEIKIQAAPVAEPTPEVVRPAPRILMAQPAAAPRPAIHAVVGATALKFEPQVDLVAEEVVETRPSGEVVPISRNLTLVQLSERTCKWPIGDPLSADFRFCGNHSGDASPYCKYHARIAFQPASERRRVR